MTAVLGIEIPPIQYVTAPDGTDIAYAVLGEGEPFVFLPMFFNHVQDVCRAYNPLPHVLQSLAERFRLINFDSRGLGLSKRCLAAGRNF